MLHKLSASIAVSLLLATPAFAQTQTPRQALIEMFSGRDSKALERHLPKIMQQRLAALNSGSGINGSPVALPKTFGKSGDLRWFETGPILLQTQNANSRLELRVEKEVPSGDRDDFELSWNFTMDGKTHASENGSRLLLTMQKEDGIWKLSEIGLTLKMKLDGSLIEAFSKQMNSVRQNQMMIQPMTVKTLSAEPTVPARSMSAHDLNPSETAALESLRNLLSAQKQYRMENPSLGFSCDPASLSADAVNGYRTMIVACQGTPVTAFKVMVTPAGMSSKGQRAFCADESGEVHYSDDGSGVSCLTEKNRLE